MLLRGQIDFIVVSERVGPEKIVKKRGPRFSKSNKNCSKAYLKILIDQNFLNGP